MIFTMMMMMTMIIMMMTMMIMMTMIIVMMMMRRIFSDSSRHSDSYSSEAEAVRLGKDEKLAREAGITFDVKVIISLCWQISFDKD